MSLLASTQGTPERVWSLLSVLAANDGSMSRAEAADWLNPGFTRGGEVVSEKPTAFAQTLGAATSLGAIEVEKGMLRLNPSCSVDSYAAFCDWVHQALILLSSSEKDAVVLETFAWLAVESDRQGSIGWVHDWTNDAFADAADRSLPEGADDDGDRRINKDKLPTWRRWLVSLGLMVPLPTSPQPHPLADGRAMRELARADIPVGQEIGADVFVAALATRLPYLDGGRMFVDAGRRTGHTPTPYQLSPLLSATLRNLHDEGAIELRLRGDAGDVTRLTHDPTHKVQAFHAVMMKESA
jgi:hypothetical protein